MKIAYICADFGIPISGNKGASVHVREMVYAFQKLGQEVEVFSPTINGNSIDRNEFKIDHVIRDSNYDWVSKNIKDLEQFLGIETRLKFDLQRLFYNLTFFQKLAKSFEKTRFDLIYERYSLFNYSGIVLARKFKIPHILEINSPLCDEFERIWGLEMIGLARALEHKIFTESRLLVVVSKYLGDYAQRFGVPESRVLFLPNGVDPQKFKFDEGARETVRRQFDITKKTVIGFVGNFRPWHDLETLIEAFGLISCNKSEVHLFLVGDGPSRHKLESQIRRLGLSKSVTLTGFIEHVEVPSYISAMDITVAPYVSLNDFYFSPIKIFEYMSVGKPVVGSKSGQLAELIHHRKTGLLYQPENVEELKNLLQELVCNTNLQRRLGEAAREWVVANRTWNHNGRAILNAINKIYPFNIPDSQ